MYVSDVIFVSKFKCYFSWVRADSGIFNPGIRNKPSVSFITRGENVETGDTKEKGVGQKKSYLCQDLTLASSLLSLSK